MAELSQDDLNAILGVQKARGLFEEMRTARAYPPGAAAPAAPPSSATAPRTPPPNVYDQAAANQTLDPSNDPALQQVAMLKRAMGIAEEPTQTAGIKRPAAPAAEAAPVLLPPNPADTGDDTIQAYQKFQNFANAQNPGPTQEDVSADSRRKLLGMVAAALVGGAMNRKTAAGGARGANAAVQGFAGTYQSPTAMSKARADAGRTATTKNLVDLYDHRSKQAQARTTATPTRIAEFRSIYGRNPASMEEFAQFMRTVKPENAQPQREPAIIATYRAAHGGQGPAGEEDLIKFVNRLKGADHDRVMAQFAKFKEMKPAEQKLWAQFKTGPMSAFTMGMFPEVFEGAGSGGGTELDNYLPK